MSSHTLLTACISSCPNLKHFAMVCVLMTLGGCGAAEQGGGELVDAPPAIELRQTEVDWSRPLTADELKKFFLIVNELPQRQVPTFVYAETHQPAADPNRLEEYVSGLRQKYRSAIDPAWQGKQWQNDERLAMSFERLHIDPEAFASLAIRVSVASSAAAIRGEIPILATQRKLREELEKLSFELQHPAPDASSLQQKQQLAAVQEIVALSEFLDLLSLVTDESLVTIRAHAKELSKYLPQDSVTARFEQYYDSTPQVIRMGQTTNYSNRSGAIR